MKQTMNILCGLDESYTQHCAVMLTSLFSHSRSAKLRVFLINQDLSDWSLNQIRLNCKKFGHEFVPLHADHEALDVVPGIAHVNASSYLRLLAAHLLPADVDRVMYLDSDLVVRSSLLPFYHQDLGDHYLAAVADAPDAAQSERLGLPPDVQYFNAGVQVMNLQRWREEEVGERALSFAVENPELIQWADQDALNATAFGRVKICPPKWNAGMWVFRGLAADELGVDASDLEQAQTDPVIAHYTGGRKPWGSAASPHPFASDYFRYLKQTPFFGRKHMTKRIRSKGVQVMRKLAFR